MEYQNSNISAGKIRTSMREWINSTPFIYGIISNPFVISLFILIVIWLLDMLYGKTFQCVNSREVVQHVLTAYIVLVSGILLNNLTVDNKKIVEGRGVDKEIIPEDSIISEYIDQ